MCVSVCGGEGKGELVRVGVGIIFGDMEGLEYKQLQKQRKHITVSNDRLTEKL